MAGGHGQIVGVFVQPVIDPVGEFIDELGALGVVVLVGEFVLEFAVVLGVVVIGFGRGLTGFAKEFGAQVLGEKRLDVDVA